MFQYSVLSSYVYISSYTNTLIVIMILILLFVCRRLDSNPLVCDCNLKWLRTFVTSATHLMEVAATCLEPAELSGIAISEVEPQDFGCGE